MSRDPERNLKQRLIEATQRLVVAETELTVALAELAVTDRADKRIASERLRKGMAEVITARDDLAELAGCSK